MQGYNHILEVLKFSHAYEVSQHGKEKNMLKSCITGTNLVVCHPYIYLALILNDPIFIINLWKKRINNESLCLTVIT